VTRHITQTAAVEMQAMLDWYPVYIEGAMDQAPLMGISEQEAADRAVRHLIKTDLFYLLAYGLDRQDIIHPWLFERCREVQASPDGRLDLWAREHYKLEPLTNEILTTDGWSTIGGLRVGDSVFAPSGEPAGVLALNEQVVEPEMYSLEFAPHQGESEFVETGHQHQWDVEIPVRTPEVDAWRPARMNTRQIAAYTESEQVKKRPRWLRIPVCKPIQIPEAQLPIDPYLLGVWIGDGCSAGGQITNSDKQLYRAIAEGAHRTPMGNTFRYTVPGLTAALRGVGLIPTSSSQKFIPEQYLLGSVEQRISLLQGLMDTDGHVRKNNGQIKFHTMSPQLASDVEDLLLSLGVVASVSTGNKGMYVVTFAGGQSFRPFRLDKHLDKVPTHAKHRPPYWYIKGVTRSGPQTGRCIQVEGGRYVTGRAFIPTRNSTIITFALTIQDILKDPEITVGIFSHSAPIAKDFLSQIKREFEGNEKLKHLFPDILWADPKRDAPKAGQSWSVDKGITVKRSTNPREATVQASGLVDGMPTGRHFSLLVYDDVVVPESVTTPEMIKKTTEMLEISYNLGAHGGRRRFIGTRYHYNDTYVTIMERETALPRLYPATDDGTFEGEPIFLSREQLDEKRRDMAAYVFGCQMLQDPKADSAMGFQEDWLRYYDTEPNPDTLNLYIVVDPANAKRKENDYTSMWVIGLAPDRNYYLVDGIRDRLNLTERTDALFRLHYEYRPEAVGYERYGMQADIQHIEVIQDQRSYRFPIYELKGSTPKPDRIRRLIPLFEQGRLWLPRSLYKTTAEGTRIDIIDSFVKDEYLAFPVGAHDDMLDNLANIVHPDMVATFPVALRRERKESWETRLQRKVRQMQQRSTGTGMTA